MKTKIPSAQLVWGVLLALAGFGVIYRTHVLDESIDAVAAQPGASFFVRFCLYLMAFVLIGGGLKKIHQTLISGKRPFSVAPDERSEKDNST